MVFHWHQSLQTLILPAGARVTGLIINQVRPTTVTLDLEDLQKILKHPEYLNYIAGALRPIPRAKK